MRICVVSANLGNFDTPNNHVPQIDVGADVDYYTFTDENFPPRDKAMTPRMQARIPKCFAWQMRPFYDYYLWIDGSLTLKHEHSLKHLFEQCQGYDLVALRHHRRPNIRQEVRYIRKGIRQQSAYLVARYNNELLHEHYKVVKYDTDYVDDMLLLSGVFMFKNTPQVQDAMKEWWYFISRYHIIDQLGFVYAMRKGGLKINALSDIFNDCWFLGVKRHRHHAK